MAQCRLVWLVKLLQTAETTLGETIPPQAPTNPSAHSRPQGKGRNFPPKQGETDGHQKGLAWDPGPPPTPTPRAWAETESVRPETLAPTCGKDRNLPLMFPPATWPHQICPVPDSEGPALTKLHKEIQPKMSQGFKYAATRPGGNNGQVRVGGRVPEDGGWRGNVRGGEGSDNGRREPQWALSGNS